MTSSDDREATRTPPVPADERPTQPPGRGEAVAAPTGPLRRTGHALTNLGRKRKANEDAFFVDDALGVYVVADGMGGHAAGEVASREAVDTLYGMVKRGIGSLTDRIESPSHPDTRAACRLMESAVQAATYFVYSIARSIAR